VGKQVTSNLSNGKGKARETRRYSSRHGSIATGSRAVPPWFPLHGCPNVNHLLLEARRG
jgi:hypothetical protein